MACTLKELQNTEYEILCRFADFCEEYSIEYVLSYGTLLGAVRHNGFIPWDDDVDVQMDHKNFRKFIKKIKKNPIPGFHLSWIDTDPQYPLFFAKLRKNGTFMPEDPYQSLDMHQGVWIDIFVYTGDSNNRYIANLQKKIYRAFAFLGRIYRFNIRDKRQNEQFEYSRKYRFIQNLSDKTNSTIRRILFNLYAKLDNKKSEYVVTNDWANNPTPYILRDGITPYCKHIFVDREFNIPVNYDKALTAMYGDYMNPVEYPNHTDYSNVQL